MTTLKLPRPYKPKLSHREASLMDCLSRLDRSQEGIAPADESLIASILGAPIGETKETLAALICRRCILLGTNHVAILSRLSTSLKQERDRNRKRVRRGGTADWSLHRRVLATFPSLRGRVERPASYNRPAAFEKLLSEHVSHHRRDCPANVEVVSEACYPGELSTVLTMIEEQRSAHRSVVLLYTRKAVYLGVVRNPKR